MHTLKYDLSLMLVAMVSTHSIADLLQFEKNTLLYDRHYMDEILPKRRKLPYNKSINRSPDKIYYGYRFVDLKIERKETTNHCRNLMNANVVLNLFNPSFIVLCWYYTIKICIFS